MATYVPSQPKIQNPDSRRNFLAKIYATNLAELTFFFEMQVTELKRRWIRRASSTKLFEASCAS